MFSRLKTPFFSFWDGFGGIIVVESKPMKDVLITTSYITLGQLLKRVGAIGTGGEAKYFLRGQEVRLNGEIEQRRGRKLVPGDVVVCREETYQVIHEIR